MKIINRSKQNKAQTVIEYMLMLMVVVAIVLIGFKSYLPRVQRSSNDYFNRTMGDIMGDPNPCGDGVCDDFEMIDISKCPIDCIGE